MACQVAEHLKQNVHKCTSLYSQAGDRSSEREEIAPIAVDFAVYELAQARRRYWYHINQHRCRPTEG